MVTAEGRSSQKNLEKQKHMDWEWRGAWGFCANIASYFSWPRSPLCQRSPLKAGKVRFKKMDLEGVNFRVLANFRMRNASSKIGKRGETALQRFF